MKPSVTTHLLALCCSAMCCAACTRGGFYGSSVLDVTEQGLVAWYQLDDAPATQRFSDASGRGLHGSCSGATCPTSAPGAVGQAIAVDGQQWFLIAGAPLSAALARGFTIALWARRDGGTSVLSKPQVAGVGASYELVWTTDEVWYCTDGVPDATGEECMTVGLASAGWAHFALTWDGRYKRLFVDGAEVAGTEASTVFDDTDCVVGSDREDGQFSTPFVGAIDELRLYDRALDDEVIAALAAP